MCVDSNAVKSSGVRLLVAEDDAVLRTLIVQTLREDGYTVVEVADGEQLLAAIESSGRQGEVAVVVSDVCMPHLDGLDVLAALRCAAWRTPVVLMTAFGEEAIRAEARELGAALLEKPFDLEALRAAVRRAIGWRVPDAADAG
jgi:CheY-like chemotaxis protein